MRLRAKSGKSGHKSQNVGVEENSSTGTFENALENLEGDSVVTFILTVGECTRCKGRLFLLLLTLAMLDVDRESRSYNGIRMSLDLNKKSTLYIHILQITRI